MKEIKPPAKFHNKDFSIFLAGSIEMGKAEDWQTKFAQALKDYDVTVYNPRREDWDATWKQEIENEKFYEQVEWELDHLERVDLIVMYLQPGTMSPISLLELGLFSNRVFAMKKKMIVLCPEGFHRKGNVDIVCEYYDIPQAKDMQDLIDKTLVLMKAHDENQQIQ